MTFAEVHVKRSVILTDRLDPDILSYVKLQKLAIKTWIAFAFDTRHENSVIVS